MINKELEFVKVKAKEGVPPPSTPSPPMHIYDLNLY